jgi:hypothetical protein
MTAKAKTKAGTKKAATAKGAAVKKKAAGTTRAAGTSRGAVAPATATAARRGTGTEDDLNRLRESTEVVFERLRREEDSVPAGREEEYWRDRHIARAAWDRAELAAFENLVDQQKQQLPAVSASNAQLAKEVATTATIIGVLDVVSASLGILASVITLLA